MKVKVLCGISGSGKSTYAKNLPGTKIICSADQFFTWNGQYQFNSEHLPEAHAECLQRFVSVVCNDWKYYDDDKKTVIVDNTNCTIAEIAPYAALALAYGHELEIVFFDVAPRDMELISKRNIHKVPFAAICNQYKNLRDTKEQLPPWWPTKFIKVIV